VPGRQARAGLDHGVRIELQPFRGAGVLGQGRVGPPARRPGRRGLGREGHGRHRGILPLGRQPDDRRLRSVDLRGHGLAQLADHERHGLDRQGEQGQTAQNTGPASGQGAPGQAASRAGQPQQSQSGQGKNPGPCRGLRLMPGQEKQQPQGQPGPASGQGRGGQGHQHDQKHIEEAPPGKHAAPDPIRTGRGEKPPARRQMQGRGHMVELPVVAGGRQRGLGPGIAGLGRQMQPRGPQLHAGQFAHAPQDHRLVPTGQGHPAEPARRQHGQPPGRAVLSGDGVAAGQPLAGKIEPKFPGKTQGVPADRRAAPECGHGQRGVGTGQEGRITPPGVRHVGRLRIDGRQALGPRLTYGLVGGKGPDFPTVGADGRSHGRHPAGIPGHHVHVIASRSGVEG